MPPVRAVSKTTPQSLRDTPLSDALSDLSKYDEFLVRRFKAAVNSNDRDISSKTSKGKAFSDCRKLAMSAANSSSQCLGTVVRSGWKASEPATMTEVSMNGVLSIIQVFKLAIQSLRDTLPKSLDVERVASSFVGKMVALELFQLSLDVLWDAKPYIVALYHSSNNFPTQLKKPTTRQAKLPPSTQYCSLLQYPQPPPEDSNILSLICTAIVHSIASLTALLSNPSIAFPITADAFVSALEESILLSWITSCPSEQKDGLLSRTHKAIAFALTNIKASSDTSLRLRIWSLRCLLQKPTLDPEMFWLQATRYCVTHGKILHNSHSYDKAASDVVMLFDSITPSAQAREGGASFMKGSAYNKFCETILIFAQKGNNLIDVKRIGDFIQADIKEKPNSPETTRSHHIALFGHALKSLEQLSQPSADQGILQNIRQCCTVLSDDLTVFMDVDGNPRLIPSVEKLRRLCARYLAEKNCDEELQGAVVSFCDAFAKGVEALKQKSGNTLVTEVYTCAVDSLCSLSKSRFVPGQTWTYAAVYDYLDRASTFIEFPLLHQGHDLDYFVKLTKCVAGTLMNTAIALYQINHYSHAVRFLTLCCNLTSQLWDSLTAIDTASSAPTTIKLIEESRSYFRTALTKRWELLGDCYSKVGDRKSAYHAFLKALKFSSLEDLNDPSRTLLPGEIFSQPLLKRIGTLVERITYITVFDLFLQEEASLYATFASEVSAEALGLILEHQVFVLEKGISRPEVRSVVDKILTDTLRVYDDQYPIRRARIVVWQIDFAYRLNTTSFSIDSIVPKVLALLSPSMSLGSDQGLLPFRQQYEAMVYMWRGLLIHQRSELHDKVTPTVIENAASSWEILRQLFLGHTPQPAPERSKPSQPSPVIPSTTKVPRVATRSSPRKKPAAVKAPPPVTPRPRKKIFLTPPKPVKVASPITKSQNPIVLTIDSRLVSITDLFARLLGLLGHIPLRLHFLAALQQAATLSLESAANEFLYASADAAVEYAKIGKYKRASAIFTHTLDAINDAKPGVVSEATHILVLLSYAEVLAQRGRVAKSTQLYEEARSLFRGIERNPSHISTFNKVKGRAQIIELTAKATKVYALINVAKGSIHTALSALRQSLKLWNRAYETLLRHQTGKETSSKENNSNPFDMGSLTAALPRLGNENEVEKETYTRNPLSEYVHWRIAEGLFGALLDLADAYFLQGSIRGSEYLVEQARSLATAINSTNYVCRAITRSIEIHLHKGKLEDAVSSINTAIELLGDSDNLDAINVARLSARYQQLLDQDTQANSLYSKALVLLSGLSESLSAWEHAMPSSRRSSIGTPQGSSDADIFAPDFLAAIFAQQIWLQRNEPRSVLNELIQKLDALPSSAQVESEKTAVLARLALHQSYLKFRTDIFLSSLTESAIAIPLGLTSKDGKVPSVGARGIMETLSTAQTYFQQALQRARIGGKVTYAREASLSLATLQLFQVSLGNLNYNDASLAINLLHASTALTLRRELVEAIEQKFPVISRDDLAWSALSSNDEDVSAVASAEFISKEESILATYWNRLRSKYEWPSGLDDAGSADVLPNNWTIVNVSVSDDKSTLFVSRQRAKSQPLIFSIPINRQGRKENEDEPLSFEDGIRKLQDVLGESDRIAKAAKDVASDDRSARVAWWAKRAALDKQLGDILNDIEFCWLGAFKTALHETRQIGTDELSEIANRIETVFQRTLVTEKKRIGQFKLDRSLVECFATLSPQCRQEELEDIIYFVLDLYQFHGISVPVSEIDIDELAVQLRTVLEEYAARKFARIEDEHLFLILDKNVQGIPWESMPYLRGRSISRIPSLSFLIDRIEFAQIQDQLRNTDTPDRTFTNGRAAVNPKNTFFILNPSGDLEKSQARFEPWLQEMSDPSIGWKGIVKRKPSELEFTDALQKKDLVIYIGHGGAEQYARSSKIKHLPRCAATMLWGCSSGLMHDMGEFDRHGTPYNYMIAGCPTLIACLWDVTDNELDRFSQSVLDKLHLNPDRVRSWRHDDDGMVSVVTAVAESRDSCKLKYLTGAAPVVYGIPFYL